MDNAVFLQCFFVLKSTLSPTKVGVSVADVQRFILKATEVISHYMIIELPAATEGGLFLLVNFLGDSL